MRTCGRNRATNESDQGKMPRYIVDPTIQGDDTQHNGDSSLQFIMMWLNALPVKSGVMAQLSPSNRHKLDERKDVVHYLGHIVRFMMNPKPQIQ